jgi:glutamine---fructose-6-phosphate transaminase (isomerizing)
VTGGALSAADIAEQAEVLSRVVALNTDALEEARGAISGARAIRACGIGSSRHAAGYASEALHQLAGTPTVVLPAPGAAVSYAQPRTDEPLLVLSQSGRTPALLDAVKRSRDDGTTVIAVINEPDSPLEALADITLACDTGAERVVAATKSVTAQCLLVRALAREPDREEIATLVVSVRRALALDVARAVRGDFVTGVVSAGFAAEWVAREVALKLIEMCGTAVTGGSVVEYFHGPLASEGPILAFLDPTDPNSGQLAGRRGVITVGPHSAFDIETPSTGDPSLDAIVAIVVGQRIAHAWALARGSDPDAGRGLSKVTSTR